METTNEQFVDDVLNAVERAIMNPSNGANLLEENPNTVHRMTLVLIKCMSLTADTWYYLHANPKQVLSAILINSVDEFLEEHSDRYGERKFWEDIGTEIKKEREHIAEKIQKLSKGKIHVDEYHEKFRRDLDANL